MESASITVDLNYKKNIHGKPLELLEKLNIGIKDTRHLAFHICDFTFKLKPDTLRIWGYNKTDPTVARIYADKAIKEVQMLLEK